VVVIGRSAVKDGVPIKLDSAILLPNEIDISKWIEPAIEFVPDKEGLDQLTNMGFSVQQATAALKQADNKFETALNDLLSGKFSGQEPAVVNEEDLVSLISMGFDEELARRALKKAGNREAACELLLSSPDSLFEEETSLSLEHKESAEKTSTKYSLSGFVSHKGPSLHCGHYIAHVLDSSGWLLYNDEKVVRVTEDSKSLPDTSNAYIAFYIRN
jgi:ubiquitin carboxyl-terminal hydrolase 5/13